MSFQDCFFYVVLNKISRFVVNSSVKPADKFAGL